MSGTLSGSVIPTFADRVIETTSFTGTGPVTLNGPVAGCNSFASQAQFANGALICFEVYDPVNYVWEICAGTYDAKNNQLVISQVLDSTNNGNLVSFLGNPNTTVMVVLPASIISSILNGIIPGASNISCVDGVLSFTEADGKVVSFSGKIAYSITGVTLTGQSVASTATAGTVIGTLTATESSTGGTPSFGLVSDTTGGAIAIKGDQLVLANTLAAGTYSAVISVTDAGATNSPQNYTVTFQSVQGTSITGISISSTTFPAGAAGQTVGTLSVTGVGSPTATFALTGFTDATDFAVSSSGVITTTVATTAGSYPLTVVAIPPSPNLATPTAASGQVLQVIGTGPDMFVLELTQANYGASAEVSFTVANQDTGTGFPATSAYAITALNGSTTPDLFVIRGTFGAGQMDLTINVTNYNNTGTASAPTDLRTATVVSASYNGEPQAVGTLGQLLSPGGAFSGSYGYSYIFNRTTFQKNITLTATSTEAITAIISSNTTVAAGQPAGTVVGTLSLQGSGLSGTPTFSINPAQSPNFTIANGNQLVTAVANLGAGYTYSPFITATLTGASNSPFTQQIPITCTASTTGGTTTTSGTQEINGLTLTDLNGNNLTTIEAGTAQYTQIGVLQATGSAGPLADPITYSLSSQSGPVNSAFAVTNYRELVVNVAGLSAGTYNVTMTVACPTAANTPQSYPFTITVAAAGTITLNAVATSVVRGEQLLLSGTYTGTKPLTIGYAMNGGTTYIDCYNLVVDSPSVGSWSAVCPAPTLVGSSNTVKVCKGTTGITSSASNTFATIDYDTGSTFRLFFTPHAVVASGVAPNYPQYVGSYYFSGGVGPYTIAMSVNNGGSYWLENQNNLGVFAHLPGNRLSGGVNPTMTLTATDSTGATVSHTYTIVLTPFARFALTNNVFFSDAGQQGYIPMLLCWANNPLVTDQATYISDTSNGPNFTTQWGMGNGIWGGGYYGGVNNYGGESAYGDYPTYTLATTSYGGGYTVPAAFNMLLLQNIAPFNVTFIPSGSFSSAAPNGFVIGELHAGTMDNSASYLFNPGNANLIVSANSGAVTIISPLPAGTFKFSPSASNSSHVFSTSTLTINVPTGTVLPATNMTATVASNLNNYPISVYGSAGTGTGSFYGLLPTPLLAVTPAVTGITGTITWTLHQNNVTPFLGDSTGTWMLYSNGNDVMPYRYQINPSTGVVNVISYPSAETDVLTITAYDGTNSCTQQFNVVVAAVQGPTFHCGQGMSTTYQSGGYEYMTPIRANYSGAYGGAIFSGQTILIYPNSNINYYANDNGNGAQGTPTYDVGGTTRHGLAGPSTWEGVTGGAMTRVGGTYGYLGFTGLGQDGKAFFNSNSGDLTFENLQITYVRAWQWGGSYNQTAGGYSGAGIQMNSQTPGNATVTNCFFMECDLSIHSGDSMSNMTLSNIYAVNCGCTWNGSGPMHNFYLGTQWQTTMSNILTMRTFNGHDFKNRSQNSTISNCRFFDTERGQASNQLNLPNGGAHTITNCVLHSGTQPQQNGHSIEFGDDLQGYTNIQSFSIDSSSNTYIANGDKLWGPVAIDAFGETSATTGAVTTITSTNDSFIGHPNNPGAPFNLHWDSNKRPSTTGIAPSGTVPLIQSGGVVLTAQPALDLTTPITPAITTRPGPISLPYDGESEQQYVGEMYLGGGATQGSTFVAGLGQVDCGYDDFHIAASTPVGTTITTMQATGVPYFSNNPTQPDIRINPYTSGTTWTLVTNAAAYADGSFTVAPTGTFLINSTTGALSVGAALSRGVYVICPQATAPSANGSYFVWDFVYIVAD